MSVELFERRVAALTQLRVVDPARPVLANEDDHHLRRVLRAEVGEEVVVCDGHGTWSICEVATSGLTRVSDVGVDAAPAATALYLAPLKGDRSEWAIAKATEVGVAMVVPLISQRLAVKFRGEVRDKIVQRWRRIAAETASQCRRTHDLVVADPVAPHEVPADVAVADFAGSGDWSAVRAVCIGPEGGWAPDEWGDARRLVSLGPTVLRAETAAVVAGALVAFTNGSFGFTARASADE